MMRSGAEIRAALDEPPLPCPHQRGQGIEDLQPKLLVHEIACWRVPLFTIPPGRQSAVGPARDRHLAWLYPPQHREAVRDLAHRLRRASP